jgi:outer membrane protein assembly factor BamB
MARARYLPLVSAALLLLIASTVPAGNWPTFRGADRTDVSKETGLLKAWPSEGPPLAWKADGIGRGYSTVAISDGRVYTLGDNTADNDADEYLLAFNESDGKPLWKTKTGAPWNDGNAQWQGSRSTPSTDGKSVYVITPFGVLVACDAAKGNELWRKDFKQEFKGKKGDGWGFSESPLIDGDKLICTPGGPEATVVAFNKTSGDVIWKASYPNCRGASHASVVTSEIAGQKIYVQLTASGAIGIRASDGTVLWTYGIKDTIAVCPTPIIDGDLVFIAAGYGTGGALIRQVPKGDNKVEVEQVYGMKPDLGNKHGGVVRVGEYIYADSDDRGIPYCADLKTGEIKWKKRSSGSGSASVTAGDGHLYIHFADGTMALVKSDPAEFTEVSSFKVPGAGARPSWAHPVICNGKLYLRENNSLLCYNIKQ